jgi:hypothetical protein
MYWAYDSGRYVEWMSVYPPLSFYILKIINVAFNGAYNGTPEIMRIESPCVVAGFWLIYVTLPVIMLKMKCWLNFSSEQKILVYLIIIFSTPMLFALERGNLIIICPIILSIVLSKTGFLRGLGIALLINVKPYFALLLLYYLARKNWRGFVTVVGLSGLIFVATGLALDENFLLFFRNLVGFSQNEELFSLREVMAMPSSISAFSAVLKTSGGAMFASSYMEISKIPLLVKVIEMLKFATLIFALAVTFKKAALMHDAEIVVLLVVVITNLGTWVGGYSIILYAALLPIFYNMPFKRLYFFLLLLLAFPLDIIPILTQNIGEQYSYVSNSSIDVEWTLGLGSIVRPMANIVLLMSITYGFTYAKIPNNLRCLNKTNDLLTGTI